MNFSRLSVRTVWAHSLRSVFVMVLAVYLARFFREHGRVYPIILSNCMLYVSSSKYFQRDFSIRFVLWWMLQRCPSERKTAKKYGRKAQEKQLFFKDKEHIPPYLSIWRGTKDIASRSIFVCTYPVDWEPLHSTASGYTVNIFGIQLYPFPENTFRLASFHEIHPNSRFMLPYSPAGFTFNPFFSRYLFLWHNSVRPSR